MNLRQILNVSWASLIDGMEPDGVTKIEKWLITPEQTPEQAAEEERKRKARENREGLASLQQAFNLGS